MTSAQPQKDNVSRPASRTSRGKVLAWAKLLFGLTLLAFVLLRQDRAAQIIHLFSGVKTSWLLALVPIFVTTNLISSVKWSLFLSDRGEAQSQWRLFMLYWVGKFFNNFTLGMTGGDIARILILGGDIGSRSRSAATVFMERAVGVVGLVVFVIVSVAITPAMLREPAIALAVFAAVAGCCAMVAAYFSPTVSRWMLNVCERLPWVKRFGGKLRTLMDAVVYYRDRRRVLALSLLLSVLFHFTACINVYVACLAIGFHPQFTAILVVTPVVLFLTAFPVSPSGIGWWEWCFSVFLADAGGSAAQGTTVALLLRSVGLVMSLIGGSYFILDSNRQVRTLSKDDRRTSSLRGSGPKSTGSTAPVFKGETANLPDRELGTVNRP